MSWQSWGMICPDTTPIIFFFQQHPYKGCNKNNLVKPMTKTTHRKAKSELRVLDVKFNYALYKKLHIACTKKHIKFQCLGLYIRVTVQLKRTLKSFL